MSDGIRDSPLLRATGAGAGVQLAAGDPLPPPHEAQEQQRTIRQVVGRDVLSMFPSAPPPSRVGSAGDSRPRAH